MRKKGSCSWARPASSAHPFCSWCTVSVALAPLVTPTARRAEGSWGWGVRCEPVKKGNGSGWTQGGPWTHLQTRTRNCLLPDQGFSFTSWGWSSKDVISGDFSQELRVRLRLKLSLPRPWPSSGLSLWNVCLYLPKSFSPPSTQQMTCTSPNRIAF